MGQVGRISEEPGARSLPSPAGARSLPSQIFSHSHVACSPRSPQPSLFEPLSPNNRVFPSERFEESSSSSPHSSPHDEDGLRLRTSLFFCLPERKREVFEREFENENAMRN